MTTKRTIVVVGGALSGPAAAARARETDEHARILLLERAPSVSYAVGALAQHVSGETKKLADLDSEGPELFRDVYDVEVRTGVEVTKIDSHARVVVTANENIAWDALIYAVGAGSIMPDIAGLAGATNVHVFRNLLDLRAITAGLRRVKRVAVLGGGFFGIEAADALTRRGTEVVLIERGPRLLPTFAAGASHAARKALAAAGATVETNAVVVSVERRGDRVRALRLADGRELACDLVVVAVGVRPRSELLRAAGARVLDNGAIRIDSGCRTSLPDVFACGSCVAVEQASSGRHVWIPQAAIADRTAQVAGAMAGGFTLDRLTPMLGTAIVRAGAATIARTGLTRVEAEHAEVTRVHAPSHDWFVPGAATVSMELLTNPSDGTLLGADLWGNAGVDKRVDVMATAIAGGLTARALAMLDLAYAPPFARARDVVNVAASVALARGPGRPLAWSPAELDARIAQVDVYDLRGSSDRKRPSVPGARTITFAELRAKAGSLASSKRPIVFVSSDGARAYQAAAVAFARGVRDAGYLSGGLLSWTGEGRTVQAIAAPTAKKKAKTAVKARGAKR